MNIVMIRGELSRPATVRVLASGDRLVAYELTIRTENNRAETVPVVWLGAPASAAERDTGDDVVVIGRVRRRFFTGPGGTQSRTEVVARRVLSARSTASVAKALAAACQEATGGAGEPLR